jgi:hypothetical protein
VGFYRWMVLLLLAGIFGMASVGVFVLVDIRDGVRLLH